MGDLRELQNSSPILIDIRRIFDAEESREAGFYYKTL